MIVDFHTHIFPPDVIAAPARHIDADPTFAELYGAGEPRIAAHDDLLASMDEAGVDVSVALGFAWRDASVCRLHNDYLLEAARTAGGRIVPFCTLPLAAGDDAIEAELRRCLSLGARGFGELRPENLSFDLDGEAGDRLGRLAAETGAVLLFHVSEPVGHLYPGKQGQRIDAFYRFVCRHPEARIVAAHWGGGLPFYLLMPEVREAFANVCFDTAASSLLYAPEVFEVVPALAGAQKVLFGSDFPLIGQKRSLRRVREANLDEASQALILGGNAARLLELA